MGRNSNLAALLGIDDNNSSDGGRVWDYSKVWKNFPKNDRLDLKKEFPKLDDYLKCKSKEREKKRPRLNLQDQKSTLLTLWRKDGKKAESKHLTALKKLHADFCLDSISFESFLKE